MATQFYKDMPIEEYHGHQDILSKSMLGDFADCPARFKHRHIDNKPEKKTKSLRLGSAVHTLALEPEKWEAGYHVLPTTYFNAEGKEKPFKNDIRMQVVQDEYAAAGYDVYKNDDKQWVVEDNPKGKTIISKSEHETVEQMAEALTKNSYAVSLLKAPGYVESSIFFDMEVENPETGEIETIKMRTRPDLMRNDSLAVDLKTAESVKPEFFFKRALDYHYDLSPAITEAGHMAHFGKPLDNYAFVAIESTEPYLVECFHSTEPMGDMQGLTYMEYGQAHLESLLGQYLVCRKTGVWPGYQKKIGGMQVPGYAVKRYIEKGEF